MTPIKSIADLIPDVRNARRHNPRNVGMIVSALHEVGAARSGVIDEDGNILAGNGTAEALAQAGIERVKVVDAKGDEWVVVRRTGLSAEQKRKLSLYDNRTAELADWDADELLRSVGDGLDLSALFFDWEIEKMGKAGENGDEWKGMPEFENEKKLDAEVKSITVHFLSVKDKIEFGKKIGQGITEDTRGINYPFVEDINGKAYVAKDES